MERIESANMKTVIALIIMINLVSFALYGFDKHRAKKHGRRVSESTLLLMAAIGGSIGALLGMYIFHHKTKKPKFYIGVPLLLIIQIAIAVLLYKNWGKLPFVN